MVLFGVFPPLAFCVVCGLCFFSICIRHYSGIPLNLVFLIKMSFLLFCAGFSAESLCCLMEAPFRSAVFVSTAVMCDVRCGFFLFFVLIESVVVASPLRPAFPFLGALLF